ncbi:MAG TPA: TatD family hydrolase [Flavobacterium sp.]|jgi:TatD DNase family protein
MNFVNLHTHHASDDHSVTAIVNQYPDDDFAGESVFSVGIHPWYVKRDTLTRELQIVEERLNNPKCIAVGECGLDRKVEIPWDLQMKAFEHQLIIAEEFHKPVVLHCVGAYSDLAAMHKHMKLTVPLIIHGFSKNLGTAKQMLDHDIYLSFGKHLMRNPNLKEVFLSVPDDKIFLETDSAEETIQQVYEKAAEYKQKNIDDLKQLVWQNYERVFVKT